MKLTSRPVARFVAERRRAGYRSSVSPKNLRPLLGYLDRLGVLLPAMSEPLTPVDRLLAEFRGYLLVERGLTPGTVGLYEPVARLFLGERSEPIAEDLARLSGRDIHAFVLREAQQRGQRSAESWCARCVAAAVSARRGLDRDAVGGGGAVGTQAAGAAAARACRAGRSARLLASCDRRTRSGGEISRS